MKRMVCLILGFSLICLLVSSSAGTIGLTCTVAEIKNESEAQLDITLKDLENADFELGDIVTVKFGNFEKDMPLLNGYYVDPGEYQVIAHPMRTYIELCINNKNFAETTGIRAGDTVTLTMKEKGGSRKLQELNNLVYTDNREDYASDEIFVNFRAVIPGKLYRSASPINYRLKRTAIADRLMQETGIKTVLNMADSEEEVTGYIAAESFASPYYGELYSSGSVLAIRMPFYYGSDEFAEGIVKGFTFLSEHEPPYLIHCNEGKDRTGFAAMLLEMMTGFSPEEIIADYMLSYMNFYGTETGTEQYDYIAEKNIMRMICTVAEKERGDDLSDVDWKAAAGKYLTMHGMTAEAIETLKAKLK